MNIENSTQYTFLLILLSFSCFLNSIKPIHCDKSTTSVQKATSKNQQQTSTTNLFSQQIPTTTDNPITNFNSIPTFFHPFTRQLNSYNSNAETGANSNSFFINDSNTNLVDVSQGTGNQYSVQECKGRVRLSGSSGFITDGFGPYSTNLQCNWLIDSGTANKVISLEILEFNTECNYDYVYIFDGDSIYSPLIASLSGDISDFATNIQSISRAKVDSTINESMSDRISRNNANKSYAAYEPFKILAKSGKAFIYFHSDTAQTMPGFYIKYSLSFCPFDCSNSGTCDENTQKCKCQFGYFGDGCQFVSCPNNCTSITNGYCDKKRLRCICLTGYGGSDCSKKTLHSGWIDIQEKNSEDLIEPRAFHQAVVVENFMYILGGKSLGLFNPNLVSKNVQKTATVLKYDLVNESWLNEARIEGLTNQDHLAELSGHSAINYQDNVYVFGGLAYNNSILDSLTILDTKSMTLKTISSNFHKSLLPSADYEEYAAPIASVGHSVSVVSDSMYIFLGYNPLYGYLNIVQKYNFKLNSWSIVNPSGATVIGTIGHSSNYDESSGLIYVFGGHNSERSGNLHSFDIKTEVWTLLEPSLNPKYFHEALIIDDYLFVIGGNSYNSSEKGDQCFEKKNLVFDFACGRKKVSIKSDKDYPLLQCETDCWKTIESDKPSSTDRQGHSIIKYEEKLYMFGGFNGFLLNHLKKYELNDCNTYRTVEDCNELEIGYRCKWDENSKSCTKQTNSSMIIPGNHKICSKKDFKYLLFESLCRNRKSCFDCLNTSFGCNWCGATCLFGKCLDGSYIKQDQNILEVCYKDELSLYSESSNSSETFQIQQSRTELMKEIECRKLDTCYLCKTRPYCDYQISEQGCFYSSHSSAPIARALDSEREISEKIESVSSTPNPTIRNSNSTFEHFNMSSPASILSRQLQTCESPCFKRKSCMECTTSKCIWCSTSEQCIDTSAYFGYHNLGQCMHYIAQNNKCQVASCSDINTCKDCLANPKCGWLNDQSETGKGLCMEGNSKGQKTKVDSIALASAVKESNILEKWFFSSCPLCQCNGHSVCHANSSSCIQPCSNYTEGTFCDRCIFGYYGDPVNGGVCRPCKCNGHAQFCNRETGKCYCSTKGIIGHHCNRCDDQNHYIGDISSNSSGTCYYNLSTDYQYTFNMSKPEDHYYREINFINLPLRKDADVDFTIVCSKTALINITSGYSYKNRRLLQTGIECGSFKLRFPFEKHLIGDSNYSFFVHVYKINTPFILQIAFSQHRPIHLPHFFITFSGSFLVFFALAGLTWKLKHEYSLYMRRQQQNIELEQMANRPFSKFFLEFPQNLCFNNYTSIDQSEDSKDQKYEKVYTHKSTVEVSNSGESKITKSRLFSSQSEKKLDEIDFGGQQLTNVGGGARQHYSQEPTPISFEPCTNENVGIVSLFVQLPGKSSLAIGSALVSLTDNGSSSNKDQQSR